jgi:hypothetical protein
MIRGLVRAGGVAVSVAAIGAAAGLMHAAAPRCPTPAVDTSGDDVPSDVELECHKEESADAFNDYSWRAFLALTRVASSSERGAKDPNRPLGATTGPLVFETYKALWEVFRDGAEPRPWEASGTPPAAESPCPSSPITSGDLILSSFGKMEDVIQFATADAAMGSLVAQNGRLVRYLTAYNKVAFNAIRDQKL